MATISCVLFTGWLSTACGSGGKNGRPERPARQQYARPRGLDEWARPRMFGAREVELFVNNFKAARSRDAFEPTGFDERPAC